MRVLVAYDSQFGSTAQIADRIAHVLRQEGHDATATTVDEAPDPAAFDAAVVGSAVHAGHWLEGGSTFLDRNRAGLASRPVWLFSSGPLGDRAVFAPQPEPKEVKAALAAIGARGHRVFAGSFDRATADLNGLGFIANTVVRRFLPDGDWRDWDAIEGWARDIGRSLGMKRSA
jgi:menaquinone-dependent protoporphyrinogen oxidase